MPAPLVTPLPASPERLNKPNSFITDSIIFLDALTPYRERVNEFSSYVNATIPNKWDMGKLTGVRDFPNIFQALRFSAAKFRRRAAAPLTWAMPPFGLNWTRLCLQSAAAARLSRASLFRSPILIFSLPWLTATACDGPSLPAVTRAVPSP